MHRLLTAVLLALGAAARAQVPAGLTGIGVAAAVRGAVNGVAPGQAAGRVIGTGKPVFLNDHITTGPDSRLQILLLDETTFTLGPDSDMVLDEFVYDPKTNAGKVSAKITSGAFRFVTGKVARKDPSNMKVKLAVGTIGIRGTMVAGRTDAHGAEVVLVGPGRENNALERRGGISVFNEHGRSDIDSSGYGVTIVDGGRPSRGFRFTAAQLAAILDQLEPRHTAGREGPPDAARDSGDLLARGGMIVRDFQVLSSAGQALDQASSFASQGVTSPIDDWKDLLAVQSGIAGYQGSGRFSCAGTCTNIGAGGTFSFGLNVNFGTRQIAGDGASTVSVGGDNISVNAIGFSNLTGRAIYSLTSADAPQGTWGTLTGTTLTFVKANGQNAGALQFNLNYNYNNGAGPVTGTATGSATAPKGSQIFGG